MWISFFFIGIGRNLPWLKDFYGIAPIDIILTAFFLYITTKKNSLKIPNIEFKQTIAIFSLATTLYISMLINYRINLETNNIFEVIRLLMVPILLRLITIEINKNEKKAITALTIGICFSGIVGTFYPNNPDLLGIFQIWNPNVLGMTFSYGVLFSLAYMLTRGFDRISSSILITLCGLSIFTFSKGTWLLIATTLLISMYVLIKATKGLRLIYLSLICVFFILAITYISYDIIIWKIQATQFDASAEDGGSFSARVGLIYSSILIWINNPIWGIGIGNFEVLHNTTDQIAILGEQYYKDDNPNSAIFYILSGGGTIAGIIYIFIILQIPYYAYKATIPHQQKKSAIAFSITAGATVLLSNLARIFHEGINRNS